MEHSSLSKETIEIIPCPIHPSLVRPILLAGADRRLVLLNLTLIILLIFGVGIHLTTILAALFFAVIGQGILIRITQYDADFLQVYLRHIRYRDFYLAQSSVFAKALQRSTFL